MELKDLTPLLIGLPIIGLGLLTGGLVFFAALLLLVLAVGVDYYLLRSSVKRTQAAISVSSELPGPECPLGSDIPVVTRIRYSGKAERKAVISTTLEGPLKLKNPAEREIVLSPGATISYQVDFMPVKTGTIKIGAPRITLESRFFRDSLPAGKGAIVKVSAGVGVFPNRTGSGSIRSHRYLDLIGSIASENGGGTDFSHIREYVPGDDIRKIDWPRSSKLGRVIVKEYEESRSRPVFFILDTGTSMGKGGPMSELDASVNLTARVVNRLLTDNTMFGAVCFSRSGIVTFKPLSTGRDHVASFKAMLSSLRPVNEQSASPRLDLIVSEADHLSRVIARTEGMELLGTAMAETLKDYVLNVKTDGFQKAVLKASQSTTVPCQLVVITNLSMGLGSLMNGLRMAAYYGHQVSVILTPPVWYEDRELQEPEKVYARYREVKESISRIRSVGNVKVIDLYAGDKVDEAIYRGLKYGGPAGMRR